MFDTAFDRVIGHEGGFQDMHHDRGNWTSGKVGVGELKGTKFGLSAMTYPDYDIKNLTIEQAKAIYFEDWWIELGMERFRPAMQYQMFDAAINHGMRNASKMVQRAVGAKDDGAIGKNTMKAIKAKSVDDLLLLFISERIAFFTKVKTFDKYGKGWMNRMAGNLKLAAEDN
jgi:lysozyme family protein